MNKVIRPGARTRVLMLSATPVNNRFYDLRNQLALAYEGDSSEWQGKLDISRSVEEVFRNAQKVFNEWSKLDVASRTTDQLMQMPIKRICTTSITRPSKATFCLSRQNISKTLSSRR